ncbi:murein biosynthesis integral membrane protein MurJ [Sutcliffiella cohnii]|nr:murein biosynthesis integral membrane protein MurJ [Sutcliffiella cohnii]
MKKVVILLMIITIASKFLGFARDITLAYFYGASNISDAYLIALTIPTVIFAIIATGISTGYIPMYSKLESDYGVEKANLYTSKLTNIILLLCLIIVGFSLIFTEQIVKVFASGFEGETLTLAIKFTQISIFGIFFTGVIGIYKGFLQIKGKQAIPAMIGFPMNFIIILSIFLSTKVDIILLAYGIVVATAAQLFLLIPFVNRTGYKYSLTFDLKDENIRKMSYLALPIIIGTSIEQINKVIDRTLASQISIGGISALNYADNLKGMVSAIFVTSIVVVLYPLISKMAAKNNIDGLKKSISEAIVGVNLLVVPATIGFIIFAEPLVSLLFGRGEFDSNAIYMTSSALSFYAIGLIGFALREVISKVFYSLQDTKTPMINATIAIILNIVLNIILSRYMGVSGLALATSISVIFCTILLFISLRNKIGSFGLKNITLSFGKIFLSSILMGVAARNLYVFLLSFNISNFTSLFLSIVVAIIVYFLVISFMNISEVNTIIRAIKEKKIRKRI